MHEHVYYRVACSLNRTIIVSVEWWILRVARLDLRDDTPWICWELHSLIWEQKERQTLLTEFWQILGKFLKSQNKISIVSINTVIGIYSRGRNEMRMKCMCLLYNVIVHWIKSEMMKSLKRLKPVFISLSHVITSLYIFTNFSDSHP